MCSKSFLDLPILACIVRLSKISFSWLPSSKTPLDGTFDTIWSVWRPPGMRFRTLLGTLFGVLTGGPRQEIWFYLHLPICSGFLCATGAFLHGFGCIFESIWPTHKGLQEPSTLLCTHSQHLFTSAALMRSLHSLCSR